jgi:PAS domain-containing protein
MTAISVLLAIGLAAFVIRRIILEMRRRPAAEEDLRTLNSGLETKIAERTASLEESNHKLALEIAERSESEALVDRLSVAIEQSPVAVVITDLSGSILYVNRKFFEITGYTREEVICRNGAS